MVSQSKIRRWLAGICLALACLMVLLGLTVFEGRLKSFQFIGYWGACFCLTALAAFSALMELVLLGRQLRQEQRTLIEETLRDAKEKEKRDPID